ncbi:MAG: GNAT family N-acetyltransferase [Oscillospiraceae bacterium]|nr:GNAT family N-acetyltransferase [Oscillospiraceae bacterium]
MITVEKAGKDRLADILKIRREMLAVVNNVPESGISDEIMQMSEEYFSSEEHTTALAYCDGKLAGCASICWLNVMPTYSHPTGKRGHIMNVYTRNEYRRMGAARKMVEFLISEARARGVTHISLDATEMGRPLYEALGFHSSEESMGLDLK